LAIDWLLDGPSNLSGLPPVPRLTDAFYDPAPTSVIIRIRRRFRGKHADSRCADKAG
jgi:hypothetical protein